MHPLFQVAALDAVEARSHAAVKVCSDEALVQHAINWKREKRQRQEPTGQLWILKQ